MTDTSAQSHEAGRADTLDWVDPSDLPVEEVRDVFLTLFKALRAYQLYDPRNPVYQRFVANLREALVRVWEDRDHLQVLIEEDRFTWLGEEVYRNPSRSDSLAFLFYRDGIRDFTFRKGVEEDELERLLEALHRARTARREGDDLVTILWDLDLRLFSYSAVDLSLEGVALPGPSSQAPGDLSAVLEAELGETATAGPDPGAKAAPEASGGRPHRRATVQPEDFNPTLYALDEEDQRHLRMELGKELNRDLRMDVLHALFDRLEEPDKPERQEEILGVFRTLVPGFLSRGALVPTARILEELHGLRHQVGTLSPGARRLTEALLDDISAPATVEELVRALEDGSVASSVPSLLQLFRYLRPVALGPLLRGSEQTQDEGARRVLREAIRGIAEANTEAGLQLLDSSDPTIACGAVRLVARMGVTEASGVLARLLDHGQIEVRRAIVEIAGDLPSAALAGALQRVLRGSDRDLRVSAARVLAKLRYVPAAHELREILEAKEFRNVDVTEKVAFFEAYGSLAGEQAIGFLGKILNGRGFLGRRESAEIRAGAALGLGKIHTARAREALEAARGMEDPVVRSAVNRALREERSVDE